MVPLRVELMTNAAEVSVTVNGVQVQGTVTDSGYVVETSVPEIEHTRLHSEWRGGYGSVVVALAKSGNSVVGHFDVVGGVA